MDMFLSLHSRISQPRVGALVQLLSHVRLFVTPWTAAHQAIQSFTVSQNLLKLLSIESMMHLILCQISKKDYHIQNSTREQVLQERPRGCLILL